MGPTASPSALLACVWLGALGCDIPARDAASELGPHVVAASPPDGAEDVERLATLRISVDRRLLPSTVNRATVVLESGTVRPLLAVRFDVIDLAVVARTFDGEPLEPEVLYRLSLSDRVRDFDGLSLVAPYVVSFRTAPSPGVREADLTATWADASRILDRSCAAAGCHDGARPAVGLDLASSAGVRTTALGAPSKQVPPGPGAGEGVEGARALAGLRIIDVTAGSGRPELSYLLYKMLGDPDIVGAPMPPPGSPLSVMPIDRAAARTIAAWISVGAPTE